MVCAGPARVHGEPDHLVLVEGLPRRVRKLMRELKLVLQLGEGDVYVGIEPVAKATARYSSVAAAEVACCSEIWFCGELLTLTPYTALPAKELRQRGLRWLPIERATPEAAAISCTCPTRSGQEQHFAKMANANELIEEKVPEGFSPSKKNPAAQGEGQLSSLWPLRLPKEQSVQVFGARRREKPPHKQRSSQRREASLWEHRERSPAAVKAVEDPKVDDEAMREEDMAGCISSLWTEFQAILACIAESFGLGFESKLEANCEGQQASFVARFREGFRLLGKLPEYAKRQTEAVEVCKKALYCSIKMGPTQEPMLAPDGQTYDRKRILRWLERGPIPTSPMTREVTRADQLLRNRPLECVWEALKLLRHGHEDPDMAEEESDLEFSSANPLLDAIVDRDEDTALHLLQLPDTRAELNELHGDGNSTLLQLALIHELPTVALALLRRPDFVKLDHNMGSVPAISALHLCVAMGNRELCEALLSRLEDPAYILLRVQVDTTVLLSSGVELFFSRGLNSVGVAKRYRRPDLTDYLRDVLTDAGLY